MGVLLARGGMRHKNHTINARDTGILPSHSTGDRLVGKCVWTTNTKRRKEFSDMANRVAERECEMVVRKFWRSFGQTVKSNFLRKKRIAREVSEMEKERKRYTAPKSPTRKSRSRSYPMMTSRSEMNYPFHQVYDHGHGH